MAGGPPPPTSTIVPGGSFNDVGPGGDIGPGGFDKRMREATGVYDYDNTMKPLSAAQRRTSEGTTFKGPAIKPITPPGGRTFI
jgi:hypothetical protein